MQKTPEQIRAEMAKLQGELEAAEREEKERQQRESLLEARQLTQNVVDTLSRLNELGAVPPRLDEVLRDGKGKFNPGRYIKRPRLQGASA